MQRSVIRIAYKFYQDKHVYLGSRIFLYQSKSVSLLRTQSADCSNISFYFDAKNKTFLWLMVPCLLFSLCPVFLSPVRWSERDYKCRLSPLQANLENVLTLHTTTSKGISPLVPCKIFTRLPTPFSQIYRECCLEEPVEWEYLLLNIAQKGGTRNE